MCKRIRRTKANREHRVPLCGLALEILDEARTLVEETSPLVFPNQVGKQLEEKQLRRMRQTHKIAVAPHGFCSSFRDWAAEETTMTKEKALKRADCYIYAYHSTFPLLPITFQSIEMIPARPPRKRKWYDKG